jgi:hypothetical protein
VSVDNEEYGSYKANTDALVRHLLDEKTEGLFNKKDGNLLHAAQVAFRALSRLEVLCRDIEEGEKIHNAEEGEYLHG